jgi:hypothetical protein
MSLHKWYCKSALKKKDEIKLPTESRIYHAHPIKIKWDVDDYVLITIWSDLLFWRVFHLTHVAV